MSSSSSCRAAPPSYVHPAQERGPPGLGEPGGAWDVRPPEARKPEAALEHWAHEEALFELLQSPCDPDMTRCATACAADEVEAQQKRRQSSLRLPKDVAVAQHFVNAGHPDQSCTRQLNVTSLKQKYGIVENEWSLRWEAATGGAGIVEASGGEHVDTRREVAEEFPREVRQLQERVRHGEPKAKHDLGLLYIHLGCGQMKVRCINDSVCPHDCT